LKIVTTTEQRTIEKASYIEKFEGPKGVMGSHTPQKDRQ